MGPQCAAVPCWAAEVGRCCDEQLRSQRASGLSGPAGLAGVLPLALDPWSAARCHGRNGAGPGAHGGVPILAGTLEEAPGL
ncbi:hypothetical protein NDU88_002890 [Pleurodeles waltl]|uniref:Uncharacterized protein n=1 Tax=Pleurodeles waltl TaxID=8319 RepID=A0AAV7NIC2_PLEWA|nr:hypothetical protein NDU88_002890 [Pleurodeles waltl]